MVPDLENPGKSDFPVAWSWPRLLPTARAHSRWRADVGAPESAVGTSRRINMASDRGWRGDAASRDEWDRDEGGSLLPEPPAEDSRTQKQWSRRLIRWAEHRFPSLFRDPGELAGEEVLHDLVQDLAATTDPEAVGQALTDAARRLTGSDAVELVPNSGWRPLSGAGAVIELRRGDGVWGWLVVNEDVFLPRSSDDDWRRSGARVVRFRAARRRGPRRGGRDLESR